MEALILLVIGVTAMPILLIIIHSSENKSKQHQKNQTVKLRVSRPGTQQRACPRCGSPVIQYRDGWECGWCGDSGRW